MSTNHLISTGGYLCGENFNAPGAKSAFARSLVTCAKCKEIFEAQEVEAALNPPDSGSLTGRLGARMSPNFQQLPRRKR